MSTNYYWYESGETSCPHCNQHMPRLHIGKYACGWVFGLRAYPEKGLNSFEDWCERWKTGLILDEYDCPIKPEEMRKIIDQGDATPIRLKTTHSRPEHQIRPGGPSWEMVLYEFS